MTIEQGDRAYDCNLVGRPVRRARESTAGAALPASEVLRVAVAAGAYDVVRRPAHDDRGRAGALLPRAGDRAAASSPTSAPRPIGASARDGIPLRQRVVRPPGNVDEQVATGRCDGRARRAQVEPLAAELRPERRAMAVGAAVVFAAVSFYDEVMRELVLALGGALFLANALALVRRRERRVARRGRRDGHDDSADLAQAPLARTVTYMLIGSIVAVWALASIVTQLTARHRERRVPIGPRRGLLELRADAEQHVFAPVARRRAARRSGGRRRSSAAGARSRVGR